VLEERGDQLGCEFVGLVDVLDIKIDRKVPLTGPLEDVGHDPRLSKTAWGNEVDVVSRQQIPNTLDEMFTPEQLVGFRYAPGEAPNSHIEKLLAAANCRMPDNSNRFVAFTGQR